MTEPAAPQPIAIRYRAFLSYAHVDTGWAKWLHAALERFRVDQDLAGRETPLGPVPKTLRPIFRDRDDFSGGHSLTDATLAAIDASAALIVLCSSVAATRPVVNEEVRLFRSRHPERPVIPVIIDGTYPDNFPPALRFEIASDGTVTDRPMTLLGADLRESADGKTLGLAKCVAGLLGVSPDDIYRRAERARKRRNRIWAALAGLFLLLAVTATASAAYAWHQLKTNEAFLDATLDRFTSIVNRAVGAAQTYSLPLPVTLTVLEEAEAILDVMSRYGRPTPKLKYRQAIMMRAFADNYRDLGRTGDWERRINEASRIMAELLKEEPDNTEWALELGRAHDRMGQLLFERADLSGALREYRARLAIMSRLTKSNPSNNEWQVALASTYASVGSVLTTQGQSTAALQAYRENLTIVQMLAKSNPTFLYSQHDVAITYAKIGDVLAREGELAQALQHYSQSAIIMERLVQADPTVMPFQRSLAVAYHKATDVLIRVESLDLALQTSQAALAILERLSKSDPANTNWQRDVGIAQGRVGDVLKGLKRPAEALRAYRENLAIMERLAKADPDNASWQWDVVAVHWRLAEHGDEPARRWRFIVTEIKRLSAVGRLRDDWVGSLQDAEENLAKVTASQPAP